MPRLCLLLLIFLILSSSKSSFSQKKDSIRKFLNENIEFTDQVNSVYPALATREADHWLLHAVYPDTNTLLQIYFSDRSLKTRDGDYTLYHPHGIKAQQGTFRNNLPVGNWQFWYANGQKKDSGRLEEYQMTGTWKSWYHNGQLKITANYAVSEPERKPGEAQQGGKSLLFDPSRVRQNRQGTSRSWFENGQLKDSGSWEGGRKEGPWKTWYANGQLESTGVYRQDSLIGEWQWLRDDGSRSTTEVYSRNKIVKLTCYDEAGRETGDFCPIQKPAVAILYRFIDFDKFIQEQVWRDSSLALSADPASTPTVKLQYTISKQGKLTQLAILESPDSSYSRAAERIFRSIEKWSPAVSHNRPVDFTQEYSISFYPREDEP